MLTCAACGHATPDGFRFCGACGAEMSVGTPPEVRKTVTVLFADVTGFTSLAERVDPESLRRVMSRYFAEMRSVIAGHGGTVEKFIGDAVMAVFGVPRLHEDDALRAVRAASEMQRRLGPLNVELEREFEVTLRARIGVNTGEVVTGETGSGDGYATGDTVNVAARLEQAAEPGEVLLGASTWELTRHAIDAEAVGPMELKGKAELVAAYRLRGVADAQAFERRLDAPLVGRDRELSVLREALDDAIGKPTCRLVTLLGPPGIGKSRLAREILLGAETGNRAIGLIGQCLPYGEGITYWPLLEIFRALGAEDELRVALDQATPEEVAWAVRKSLERRARERPLVLVLEDVHWAEPTLLDLLEHLVDWTRDSPLLLVCLARSELLDNRPGWGAGRPNAQSLALAPLSDGEADQLIEDLLHGSTLDARTRIKVHDAAEGNPLFVEQLLAMLAEDGSADRVPPTIQALLAARLDILPDGERDLVERASVIGLEFDWDTLAALSADGRRPAGMQLGALVRKEMLRPHETREDGFRFRHILIRNAAYERIPKERRADLHEQFARWLRGTDEAPQEIVGYHLEQAHRYLTELGRRGDRARGLAEEAAEQLSSSGRRAEDRGDGRAAANLLGRAAALLPADARQRVDLLPSLGNALRDIGQMEKAEHVLTEAVDAGRAAGHPGIAAAAGIALADLHLHRDPSKYGGQEEARRVVQEAIAVFEEIGDKSGLALAFGHRGKLLFWAGQAEAALGNLERAAAYAREAGDRVSEAEIIRYVLAALYRGPTPVVAALQRLRQLAEHGPANRRLAITALAIRAVLTAMQGSFEEARHLIAQAQALAAEAAILVIGSGAASAGGEVEMLAGDFAGVERELRSTCEEFERIGELGYLSSLTPLLIDAVFRQGRLEEALRLSERWQSDRLTVPEDADAHVGWRRVRAKVLAHAGETSEADVLSRGAVELATATDFLPLQARALADRGEVLWLAGRTDEADEATTEAIRRHEQKGNLAEATALSQELAARRP